MLRPVTGRVCGSRLWLALGALCFAACNTYDESLLVSLGASEPAGGGAGSAGRAGSGSSGAHNTTGGGAHAGYAGESGDSGAGDEAGASGAGPDEAGGTSGGGTVNGGASGTHNGGSSGSAGSVVSGGAPSTGGSPAYELIDDFEDQDGFILPLHKRNGPWYVFHDATAGTILPFAFDLVSGAGAAPGSTTALHVSASKFSDWGAGVGADLVNTAAKKVAYDVSAYKGVRFYAKVATGAVASIKLLVPTTFSDPDGGICMDSVATKKCSDHFFYPVSGLKTSWDVYQVDFADLVQQGFGLPQAALDPKSVYSFQFTASTKVLPLDLWIDDLSFVLE